MKVNGAALRILHRRTGFPAPDLPIGTSGEKLTVLWTGLLALGLLWASVWGLLLLIAFVGLAVVSEGVVKEGNEMSVNPAPVARDAQDLPIDYQPETNSFGEDHVYYLP